MIRRLSSGARAFAAVALLFAALVSGPAPALAVRKLGLSAGTFRFDLSAGQQASGQVIVSNDGNEPLKVMVYASDQKVDDKGNITYQTPTRADLQSLTLPSSWTTIKMPENSKSLGNIPYLELSAGQNVPVKFTLSVPPTVAPGDHDVVIFFESFEPPKAGQGAQSNISGRLGARVTLRVAGTIVSRFEVRPFDVPAYVIGGIVPYRFTVRNTGNVDQRIGARVLLLDRNDNEIQRQTAIDGVTVFAGSNREASGTLVAESMPVGPFKVRIDVSPVDDNGKATNGGADTITETRTLWLVPFWLIAALVVFAVLVFARVVWMLATGAARRQQLREAASTSGGAPDGGVQPRPFPDSEYEQQG